MNIYTAFGTDKLSFDMITPDGCCRSTIYLRIDDWSRPDPILAGVGSRCEYMENKMKPIEVYSNWCYHDYLDGKELKDGQRLLLLWPDGLKQSVFVRVESTIKYLNTGSSSDSITIRKAFVNVMHHGAHVKIFLEGTGVLAEREGYEQ